MSPDERLLSVAEIARRLGVPESTVHYWKNRFAQHLPSSGSGRQKRFRPEAVEVFRVIAEMFSLGHSAQDVMDTLGKRFPLTAHMEGDPFAAGSDAPFSRPAPEPPAVPEAAVLMAAAMGREMGIEIAKSIGEGLGQVLAQVAGQVAGQPLAAGPGADLPALGSAELTAIKAAVDETCGRLDASDGELSRMATENAELKAKLAVLEAELIRLRKDRREMEKYLLDKIRSMTT